MHVSGPKIANAIDRHEWQKLGRAAYRRDYLRPLKPVIITGAIDHWKATGLWSPEYFRDKYPELRVSVDRVEWRMADLMQRVLESTPQNPAPYLRNKLLSEMPRELQDAVHPMPQCTLPNWLASKLFPSRNPYTFEELYIGGAGATFPFLHYDNQHTHAFLMQLHGEKEYLAFAPNQAPYLYTKEGTLSSHSCIECFESPDLERYPEYANATGVRFRLHPGDTLFVPAGWWHTVKILSPSVTVSVNGANGPNWKAFVSDYCKDVARHSRAKSALLWPYLHMLGLLSATLEWFDP